MNKSKYMDWELTEQYGHGLMIHRNSPPNSKIYCRFGCSFQFKMRKISNSTLPGRRPSSSTIPHYKQQPISNHHSLGPSSLSVKEEHHLVSGEGGRRSRSSPKHKSIILQCTISLVYAICISQLSLGKYF
jgi:hypothetical protein